MRNAAEARTELGGRAQYPDVTTRHLRDSIGVLFGDVYPAPNEHLDALIKTLCFGQQHLPDVTGNASDPAVCAERVLHRVTRDTIRATRAAGRLPVHAGLVASECGGILFPGASGTGKTTLVLELVRAHGLLFMTDELADVCPVSMTASGLPRPANIKLGSQALIPSLDPAARGLPTLPSKAWLVPSSVGGWRVERARVPIAWLLFPQRSQEPRRPEVQRISPAEAAVLLGEQTSYLQGMPHALSKLKRVVTTVPSAVLRYQEVGDGAAAVTDLLKAPA